LWGVRRGGEPDPIEEIEEESLQRDEKNGADLERSQSGFYVEVIQKIKDKKKKKTGPVNFQLKETWKVSPLQEGRKKELEKIKCEKDRIAFTISRAKRGSKTE